MAIKSSEITNPFLEAWWAGTEQLMQVQSEWLSNPLFSKPSVDSNSIFEGAEQNWKKCQEQFNAWFLASEEWFQGVGNDASEKSDFSKSMDALKALLDPMSFFNSGLLEFDNVFQKLVDVPDFADVGIYEKKFLRMNKAWQECQTASTDYHAVLSSTWAEAFKEFTSQLSEFKDQNVQPKELLQQWLDIANKLLIGMQRSDLFLEAQNKLVEAHTKLKLQQKEMTESWCESMMIPSRSEVDDLHRIVHDLRRQVRSLKRQLDREQKVKDDLPSKPTKKNQSVKKSKITKKKSSVKKEKATKAIKKTATAESPKKVNKAKKL